MLEKKDMTLA